MKSLPFPQGLHVLAILCLFLARNAVAAEPAGMKPASAPLPVEVRNATIDGKIDGETARLVIQATLGGLGSRDEPAIFGTRVQHSVRVTRQRLFHSFEIKLESIRGALREVALPLLGAGDVRSVAGEGLSDWGVRQGTNGARFLVLHLGNTGDAPRTRFTAVVGAETPIGSLPASVPALTLAADPASLVSGYVRIETPPELGARLESAVGLVPIEPSLLPDGMRPAKEGPEPGGLTTRILAYRFHGDNYSLPIVVSAADPESREVIVSDFSLAGDVTGESATFTLSAVARVRNASGGTLELLSGGVALGQPVAAAGWRMEFEQGRFRAVFGRAGEYPIEVRFHAGVVTRDGWSTVDFRVAAGALAPVLLRGLAADTQLQLADAAKPERQGAAFASFLPSNGRLRMSWRQARTESEGKLFYAAEAVTQVAVSPGLLLQTTLLDLKVMQGELGRVELRVTGDGEITRVQGPQVLSWEVQPVPGTQERRLSVQFNQPQRDQAHLQLQVQRSLGAFPLAFDAVRLRPEGATRFGGYVRIVNEGAVRLEVVQSTGLSQISPEQFVQSEATKALLPAQSTQVFAYRFAGAESSLRIQADNILPELAVSEVLVHRLGETELSIDGEFEVDVREAPLRELVLRVPKGYSLARLEATGLSDHFLTEPADAPDAQLRLVYGAPTIGRQVVQLRLERNQALGESRWTLPRVEVLKARSVRGHVGVVAEAGFRLTPAQTTGLTELAPAFFPKKVPGLQSAFRIADPVWSAAFTVERLAQSIQADALHLFSVGEGIAYGSSLLNYVVSGAPVSTLRVELSGEYFNVEFTGKNIRNWQKTERGYQVQLHTPVSGAYTLLVTCERPFKAQGETLAFTGARAVDAQTEQGYTLVVSTYQFQVQPASVTGSLAAIEPGEVPTEYRLFFDAPILAAYRYTARPFNLQLDLKPLVQGETVSQVVDRASLTTRVSDEGQVVTEARYLVKNKGAPNLRLRVPDGSELWSVTLDGATVVPVKDDKGSFIPLPHRPDPNVVSDLLVKIASKARNPRLIEVAAPIVAAPVLLADWSIEPAGGRRLEYRGGTLIPAEGIADASGFASLWRLFADDSEARPVARVLVFMVSLLACALVWSQVGTGNAPRFTLRHILAGLLGLAAVAIAGSALDGLSNLAREAAITPPNGLRFVAPVQQGDVAWRVEIANIPLDSWRFGSGSIVLTVVAATAWIASAVVGRGALRGVGFAVAWSLGGWSALRASQGASAFFIMMGVAALIHVVLPAFWRWWQVPPHGSSTGTPAMPSVAAAALILAVVVGCAAPSAIAQGQTVKGEVPPKALVPPPAPFAIEGVELVDHEIRIEDDFVFGTAKIRWNATTGQVLPLFREPGVLTRSSHPTNLVRLVAAEREGVKQQLLVASAEGPVEFPIEYQSRVVAVNGGRGFQLPVHPGLVNRVRIILRGLDVDVSSPQSVQAHRDDAADSTNTVTSLVLSPSVGAWIEWRPRTRDTRREKAVFYAELTQLFVPGPGVIEASHDVRIRPAQGEVAELTFTVAAGATITDVVTPALSLWRFDPDTRRLRVGFAPPQSKPFAVQVRSQMGTSPLPFERATGLLAVDGAAGQFGLVGVATGTEVQLDDVSVGGFSPINLEDFPADSARPMAAQTAGLTVRRAFRYSAPGGTLTIKASPVEAEVRVDSQQTLSLGEDRTVLAATLGVEVMRAGIFKLSFVLPPGLDVESVGGAALSHWTELKADATRVVTLHLKGKTQGRQQFTVTLVGAGVRSAKGWGVPRLSLREAAKQRGQLLVVPEQGLRLQVAAREGATQLDPMQAGVRQKGVLAFRLLQDPWALTLDLERVDAWVQVTGLQHVTFTEAQIKAVANLQYEIENTGVKTLVIRLPAAAENVRFRGEQIADFLARPGLTNAPARDWEVKLERRILGRFLLHAEYTLPLGEQALDAAIDGIEARDVNLQRGFIAVQAGGRLQVRVESPGALQPTEWQVIPRVLLQDLGQAAASHTFRLVEPAFRLPVRLDRREATKLLPARVNSVTLTSAISDDGAMLTQVRMLMLPGDKRLLHLTLPDAARFWFAFVNQNSVWPWTATNQVLIPLEQNTRSGEPTLVEFFYSSSAGRASPDALSLRLSAPKFDLPLENIAWNVHLNEKWHVRKVDGSLQLREDKPVPAKGIIDPDLYIHNEAQLRREKTEEAGKFLNLANNLVQQGDPAQARRAFRVAYGMSQHDQAFNEDARVQLNNHKIQQALVGLNVRQVRVAGETAGQAVTPKSLWDNANVNYSQGEAKQLLDRNSAEENAVQQRLAERLIQQQDAAVANPAAIRAALPEQGRRLTFTRPLEVNTWADLHLNLEANESGRVSSGHRLVMLGLSFVALLGLLGLTAAARGRDPS